MRKTKIISTLGKTSENSETIFALAEQADGFRFNFSHADHIFVKDVVKKIRKASLELKKHISLIGDTKGPEVRTTNRENIHFKTGQRLQLVKDIGITHETIVKNITIGDKILFDDGNYAFIAVKTGKDAEIEALSPGMITPKRKVNIPGRYLRIPFLHEQDIKDIELMKELDFDFIAASFVSSTDDLDSLKVQLNGHEDNIKIIAKIESVLGVENLESIITKSYGVMVARGDLGVEIPFEKVPEVQTKIIKFARERAKLSIVATHMLKSMVSSMAPTRAEVSDVYNAVREKADSLMLSEETASGKYPVESISAMDKIIKEAEKFLSQYNSSSIPETKDYKDIIAHSAISLAEKLNSPIVAPTMHGTTPRKLSKYRANRIIYAVSPREKVAKHLSLVHGCYTLVSDCEPVFEKATEVKKILGIDKAVFVFGYPEGNHNTNSIAYL
jgi:pyruvate kinase